MTEDQLQEHGYPRTNPEASGRAIIYNLPEKKPASDREAPRRFLFFYQSASKCYIYFLPLTVFIAFNKICCRCGAEYKVNANGNCVRKEECSFHWGPLRRHKGLMVSVMMIQSHVVVFVTSASPCACPIVAGGWETSYRCCAAAVGAPGCQVSKVLFLPSLVNDFCG